MAPSILLRDEESVSITDSELTAVFSSDVLDNDVNISGLDDDAPVVIW